MGGNGYGEASQGEPEIAGPEGAPAASRAIACRARNASAARAKSGRAGLSVTLSPRALKIVVVPRPGRPVGLRARASTRATGVPAGVPYGAGGRAPAQRARGPRRTAASRLRSGLLAPRRLWRHGRGAGQACQCCGHHGRGRWFCAAAGFFGVLPVCCRLCGRGGLRAAGLRAAGLRAVLFAQCFRAVTRALRRGLAGRRAFLRTARASCAPSCASAAALRSSAPSRSCARAGLARGLAHGARSLACRAARGRLLTRCASSSHLFS